MARWSLVLLGATTSIALLSGFPVVAKAQQADQRFLYVAEPGIRDYLEYGGHGILVFNIDKEHQFVKRIKTSGFNEKGKPLNVKGVCDGINP